MQQFQGCDQGLSVKTAEQNYHTWQYSISKKDLQRKEDKHFQAAKRRKTACFLSCEVQGHTNTSSLQISLKYFLLDDKLQNIPVCIAVLFLLLAVCQKLFWAFASDILLKNTFSARKYRSCRSSHVWKSLEVIGRSTFASAVSVWPRLFPSKQERLNRLLPETPDCSVNRLC